MKIHNIKAMKLFIILLIAGLMMLSGCLCCCCGNPGGGGDYNYGGNQGKGAGQSCTFDSECSSYSCDDMGYCD